MILHFCYIEGISRIDTPYFANIAEQEDYFDSHEVETIDSTFYPPHYLNRIKVDVEDINFNTTVNYLWFEFSNKRYYYFIDDIDYISETVFNVSITMDVIQTYMFNITISNGIIERKFINRWYDDNGTWKINRDYIRENVSEGYYSEPIINVRNDKTNWCYVAKTHFGNTSLYGVKQVTDTESLGSDRPVSVTVPLFLPYRSTTVNFPSTLGDVRMAPSQIIPRIGQAANIYDLVLIPFFPLNHITYNASLNKFTVEVYDAAQAKDYCNPQSISIQEGTHTYGYNLITGLPIEYTGQNNLTYLSHTIYTKSFSNTDSFTISRVYTPGVSFDSEYITQMLDENYILYSFGSNFTNTTYPLSLLERPYLYTKYGFNVESCNVYYMVDKSTLFENKCKTYITDSNIMSIGLMNSPWQEYISQNRSRWVGAVGETALDIITKGANVAARNYSIKGDISDIITDTRNYTPKKGLLKKKYQKAVNAKQRDIDVNTMSGITDMAASTVGGVIGQAIKDYNMYYAPPKPKTTADTSSYFNDGWQIYSKIQYVRDYEQCANYYHRNGFLVNEHVNHIDNIFTYVNTRYYFNILKMSDVDLHLTGVIEDTSTLEIIEERLNQGMRLWNMNSIVGSRTIRHTFTGTPTSGTCRFTGSRASLGIPAGATVLTSTTVSTSSNYDHTIFANFTSDPYEMLVAVSDSNPVTVVRDITFTDTVYGVIGDFQYDNVEKDFL